MRGNGLKRGADSTRVYPTCHRFNIKRKACCFFVFACPMLVLMVYLARSCVTIVKPPFICNVKNTYQDEFYPVLGDNSTQIFSAYEVIEGTKRVIRILVLTSPYKIRPTFTCVLASNNGTCERSYAQVEELPDTNDLRYISALITCDINYMFEITYAALMTEDSSTEEISNFVTVKRDISNSQATFTHCLPPLQNNYDSIYQFLEFIAVNRMLGAEKFTIYINSVSPRIDHILTMLQRDGLVDIVQWHLPRKYLHYIHYYGQVLAMNDCLYRKRTHTKYIVNSDLDEFIVPRKSKNWTSFISTALQEEPMAAAFYIHSFIFAPKLQFPFADFSQEKNARKYEISTLLKTNRTALPISPKVRQKYIYDPKRTDSVGIHLLSPKYQKVVWVSPETCTLNHYREDFVVLLSKEKPNVFIEDNYMQQFQDDIFERLKNLWEKSKVFLKQNFSEDLKE